jgi:hypothetical protein
MDTATSPAQSTPVTEQPFRLFDLPDELWAKIGRMVIEDLPATQISMHSILEDDKGYCAEEEFEQLRCLAPGLRPPPILSVCSALRRELRLGYYKTKITVGMLGVPHKKQELVRDFLRAKGVDARRQVTGTVYVRMLDTASPTQEAPLDCFEDWDVEVQLTARRTDYKYAEWLEWEIKFL